MTMPHLMNCSHSCEGWCLDCVKREHDELTVRAEDAEDEAVMLAAEIERLRKIATTLRAEKRYQLVREEQELLMGRWTKEESDKHLTGFDAETEKMVHGAASAAGGEEEKATG